MASVTFFGGVEEIGGNKVLIEDNGIGIFLDFGRNMSKAGQFYEEFIQVRSKCALLDLLKLGILPELDGIYPKHLLDVTTLFEDGIDPLTVLPLKEGKDYWIRDDIVPYNSKEPKIKGIFLSHAHFDHIMDISFIHKDIPIYTTHLTKILARVISNVSQNSVEGQFWEVDDYEKRTISRKKGNYKTVFPGELEISVTHEKKDIKDEKSGYSLLKELSTVERDYRTECKGKIDGITYKLIPVGHSVPGACSIQLITSDGKKILYTGDVRFHGRNEPSLEDYIAEVGMEPVDLLIIEGTRVESDKTLTEDDVFQDILEQVKTNEGLILIDFNWKDINRFDTIARIAKETGRALVINPKLAYLLMDLHNMNMDEFLDPRTMENVVVYLKRQGSYLYSKNDVDKGYKTGYLSHWGLNRGKQDRNIVRIAEKMGVGGAKAGEAPEDLLKEEEEAWDLCKHHIDNGIRAYQIRNEPSKYIFMFSFWDANELFDLSPPDGILLNSKYIKASCEPFNDEMEIDERKLMNWLDKFGISYDVVPDNQEYFKRAHVSGHASRTELKELIKRIAPKKIIPIHTENPNAFIGIIEELKINIEVIKPEIGRLYII